MPESGVVTLEKITDRAPEGLNEPYTVLRELGGEAPRRPVSQLGRFGFSPGASSQDFTFRLPPGEGDPAPTSIWSI